MEKKYLLILGSLSLVVIIGVGILFWTLMKPIALIGKPTPVPTIESTATPMPTIPPTETKSDLEKIKELFAQKYSKSISEVDVTINKNTGPYASGGVSFAGEMGGAMWLAHKKGENWQIIFDGQGTIPCESIEPENFPKEMVPECWDSSLKKLIKR